MAYASGQGESLYMMLEQTYKTLPGSVPADKIPMSNLSIAPDVSEFTSDAMTGSPSPRPNVYGKQKVGGSYDLEANVDSLQMPLRALMGGAPDNGGTANLYDHYYAFKALSESWCIEDRHSDVTQFFQWYGCYGSGAAFNWNSEGLMKMTLNVVGAKQALTQATVVNSTISDRTGSAPIEYMAATVTQGANSLATLCQSVSLNVNRNLSPIMTMDGTNQLVGFAGGIATMDGTLTTLFSDNTLLDLASAGTETSLSLLCPGPVNGTQVVVMMPSLKLKPTAAKPAGAGLNTLSFAFKPYARGSASNVPGQVRSKYIMPTVTITSSTTDSLKVKIDGAGAITCTLTAGARTPTQVASDINTAITSTGSCTVENGRLLIKSKATTGSASSVQIDATGNAQTNLGLDTTLHSGYDAQPLMFILSNMNTTA